MKHWIWYSSQSAYMTLFLVGGKEGGRRAWLLSDGVTVSVIDYFPFYILNGIPSGHQWCLPAMVFPQLLPIEGAHGTEGRFLAFVPYLHRFSFFWGESPRPTLLFLEFAWSKCTWIKGTCILLITYTLIKRISTRWIRQWIIMLRSKIGACNNRCHCHCKLYAKCSRFEYTAAFRR